MDVQVYLDFANFYRSFILGLAKIANPLNHLTSKELVFQWILEAQQVFSIFKRALTSASIPAQFNPDKEILVETHAGDYVSVGILSQYDDQRVL